jgi:acetyltransferase-like isoleucine patch superfamily enzyme
MQNDTKPADNFYTRDHFSKQIEQFGWTIGEHTYGKPQIFGKESKLHIGKFCSIAGGVSIVLVNEHRTDWVTTYPFSVLVRRGWTQGKGISGHPHSKGDVHIGNDVWLARNCTILSGVTIGSGAVVATQALVTKNVPPYSIVAGVPAEVKRYRFDENIIERLLASQWWGRDMEDINRIVPLLLSNDVEAVLQWLEKKSCQLKTNFKFCN